MPEQPLVKIGINVFVLQDNKLLLGQRIGQNGFGSWCLPGGHLEYGESLANAAKRELEEETGLLSDDLEFLQIINDLQFGAHYVHINFIANTWKGEPKVTEPDKFAAWRWFPTDQLPANLYGGHALFLPAFMHKTIFNDNQKNT